MVFSALLSSGTRSRDRDREQDHHHGRPTSSSSNHSTGNLSNGSSTSINIGKAISRAKTFPKTSSDAADPYTTPSPAAGALMPLPEFIHDEAQLPCIPPERPDLRELNASLEALAAVFPDIQIEVFRELLANFDGESRLALVADALLKNRVSWVKGRWKVVAAGGDVVNDTRQNNRHNNTKRNDANERDGGDDGDEDEVDAASIVPRGELFRSQEYRHAVQTLAWQEFKGLSRSTVNAVLAESNYSYLDARRTLVALSSKSWRFTISTFFLRRRPVASGEAENHPLVLWRSSGQGSIYPAIRATGHAELDRELFDALVAPLRRRERESREVKDRELATRLNGEEAEAEGATYDCACCFTSGPFEEFTQCNNDGHMICFRCVQHAIKEALFGQGWLSTIDAETGTLRCMAVDGGGCDGRVSHEHIRRAMAEDTKGAEILHKLDQRLAEHSLLAANLPLVRCPFCGYAELDEIYMPPDRVRYRVRAGSAYSLLVLLLGIALMPLMLPLLAISSVVCLALGSGGAGRQSLSGYLASEWKGALGRHRRRRHGQRFVCLSPECGKASCLSCQKAWKDVHVCNESSLVALRTQVEQAMSMAVKRVCPRCGTSFVKNAGCNKLTCPCGYKMCYVCRADLGNEGYRHFCDHFRPDGDPRPCLECDRCNLWESEDTDKILKEAREEAERRWMAAEKKSALSTSDKSFLATGVAAGGGGGVRRRGNGRSGGKGGSADSGRDEGVDSIMAAGRVPTVAQVFDLVAETIFV